MTNIHNDDNDSVITKEDAKLSTFDPAEYVVGKVGMQEFLDSAIENRDPKGIASAFNTLMRAQALSRLVRKTKIDRSDLCEILLGDVEPTPEILVKIAEALGLKMPAEFHERFGLQPEKTVKTSIPYTHHKHTDQPHIPAG